MLPLVPRPTSLLRLLAVCTLVLGSSVAHAQYSWIDAKGVRHFSDRPPPPSIPQHKILKAPGRAAAPVYTSTAEPAPAADAAAPTKGPQTLAQREESYQIRKKMLEEQNKKDLAEAQRRRDLAEHCRDARQMQAQVESGVRIAKFDAKGERSFMSDEERAAQLARVNKALAQCR